MNKTLIIFSTLILALAGCGNNDQTNEVEPTEYIYNFQEDSEDWTAGFADYPNEPNVEDFYELEFSHSMLPSPLRITDGALKQAGNNHSDDLFMFVKKKITELVPYRTYNISMEIEFASNASNGATGIGGSPAEDVFIKAGASTSEPLKVLDNSDNYYRMNIDKGNQAQDGANMKLIGDFANGTESSAYNLVTLKTMNSISVESNSNGEIWVVVGTDSGYEGKTTIYYNKIKAILK